MSRGAECGVGRVCQVLQQRAEGCVRRVQRRRQGGGRAERVLQERGAGLRGVLLRQRAAGRVRRV